MKYKNDNSENIVEWDISYLTHNKKYTSKEFNDICKKSSKESLDKYKELTIDSLEKVLKEKYGFNSLNTETSFEFDEI